jgi:hypothetical protein
LSIPNDNRSPYTDNVYLIQVNYRENYFQHTTLTKISGNPAYASLAKLERECKANGKSVSTTLGGGLQGHLGLVCSTTAYNRISPGVPFDRPILPVIPNLSNSTVTQINEARQLFKDNLAAFNACNLIERIIVQQINTALDDDCLADLINDNTGLLEGTIPHIIQTLFDTYGAITPQLLAAEKAKVEALSYNRSRPIVTIFTAINEYASMAKAAHAAKTTEQLINIGVIIVTRSTMIANYIRQWHDKPVAKKTWPLFKEHFKAAQKAIKRSQPATTTDSLGYHEQVNTADSIVDQVIDRLVTQRDDVITITADSVAEQQMQQQINNMANSTQQSQQMVEQMTALASTVSTLKAQLENSTNNQDRGRSGRNHGRDRTNNRDSNRRGRGNRGGGRGPSKGPFKYCWTHRNCARSSADCKTPTGGHIKDATYSSMKGGSTDRCHWL